MWHSIHRMRARVKRRASSRTKHVPCIICERAEKDTFHGWARGDQKMMMRNAYQLLCCATQPINSSIKICARSPPATDMCAFGNSHRFWAWKDACACLSSFNYAKGTTQGVAFVPFLCANSQLAGFLYARAALIGHSPPAELPFTTQKTKRDVHPSGWLAATAMQISLGVIARGQLNDFIARVCVYGPSCQLFVCRSVIKTRSNGFCYVCLSVQSAHHQIIAEQTDNLAGKTPVLQARAQIKMYGPRNLARGRPRWFLSADSCSPGSKIYAETLNTVGVRCLSNVTWASVPWDVPDNAKMLECLLDNEYFCFCLLVEALRVEKY